MKKIFSIVILTLSCVLCLTSCSFGVARPEIKEGRFNITVTYEQDGEVKTASAVYVCEYDGILWYNINGEPCVKWNESFEGDITDGYVIPICNTDDGGEILISFLLRPEYFMGDPEYADHIPTVKAELLYEDDQIDDPEIIAEYGVRLIGYEYDEPIENSFKALK